MKKIEIYSMTSSLDRVSKLEISNNLEFCWTSAYQISNLIGRAMEEWREWNFGVWGWPIDRPMEEWRESSEEISSPSSIPLPPALF